MDKNIEQLRAEFALECVLEIAELQQEDIQKSYRSYIQSLPAMIQMNGFGQAIAFYRSKAPNDLSKANTDAYARIYLALQAWLLDKSGIYPNSKKPDLLWAITHNDMFAYQHATSETQALLLWFKKFARAYLQKGE